jgi:uncharacterized protein
MAKIAGPMCNMHCGYCYYLGKKNLFDDENTQMSEEILSKFIAQRIEASSGKNVHFEWHGGEPTLLGLDYFRKIIELQNSFIPPGRTFTNGLQTNGILIDSKWADFLSREKFSVGLSLDGPCEFHDIYRKTSDGLPTHSAVERTFRLLTQHNIFCNVLCVIHSGNVGEPDKVYGYFRDLGVQFLQFLPLVHIHNGNVSPMTASSERFGSFLCRIFDRWIREGVGVMVIQQFDEALRPVYGIDHALCINRDRCGDVAVIEHDGSIYMCDHFVDQEHKLGSIVHQKLGNILSDDARIRFGSSKHDLLPEKCRSCNVLAFCNGGCPKDRILSTQNGESGLNYFCDAYKSFYVHSKPGFEKLAAHIKSGKKLRSFS